MPNEFNFDDLTPLEIPVLFRDKKYKLYEATEDAARQYNNSQTKCTEFSEGGVSGIKGPLADSRSLLLSLCLFNVNEQGDKGSPVPLKFILSWPARVVKPLFEKLKEISGIDEDEESEDSLKKEIEKLQVKLTNLQKDSLGNGPGPTEDNFV